MYIKNELIPDLNIKRIVYHSLVYYFFITLIEYSDSLPFPVK
jgi:hypothetical protein